MNESTRSKTDKNNGETLFRQGFTQKFQLESLILAQSER